MLKSSAQFVDVLSHFSGQVSDGLRHGRYFLRTELPFANSIVATNSQNAHLSDGPITHIIITCLSYTSMFWNDGKSMEIKGPKHDLCLLLKHFRYGEKNPFTHFTLLNDFEAIYTDSTGHQQHIPKADTSRAALKKTIQKTMSGLAPGSKVLFYYGGHGIDDLKNQSIISGDGMRISGSELRSWLNNTRHRSVSVAAVFDACHSGGSLGLPYNYEATSEGFEVQKANRERKSIPMIQISAARSGQLAYSNRYKDGYFGQLTWTFIQYLKTNADPTIEGLVYYLQKNCDSTGAQLPQVCASHEFSGQVPFSWATPCN